MVSYGEKITNCSQMICVHCYFLLSFVGGLGYNSCPGSDLFWWFLKFSRFFKYLKTEQECFLSYIAFAWRAYAKRWCTFVSKWNSYCWTVSSDGRNKICIHISARKPDGRSSEHILSEKCLYPLCIIYISHRWFFNPVVEETPSMRQLCLVGLLLAYFFGNNTIFL